MNYKYGKMDKHFPQYICRPDDPVEPGAYGDMGAGMDNTSSQGKLNQYSPGPYLCVKDHLKIIHLLILINHFKSISLFKLLSSH